MLTQKRIPGQGLVELALVLPVLLLLVIGVLDIGRAFYIKIVLENAARGGAYYMVYHPDGGKVDDFSLAKTAVQIEATNSGILIGPEDINIQCLTGGVVDNNCPSGCMVVVSVQHNLDLVVGSFFLGPLSISNEARMFIP